MSDLDWLAWVAGGVAGVYVLSALLSIGLFVFIFIKVLKSFKD